MADDRLALDDVLEELRMLRHVVSEVINHCAGGGYVDRRGALFKDLRKVHRATRDRQTELKQIWPELPAAPWYREADPRYWQNLACCMAFFAGDRAWHLEGAWSVVLDSMLDAGGRETSLARSLAEILGIELRQSRDGGQTWHPVPTLRARLEEATDRELELELQRRQKKRSVPPALEELQRRVDRGQETLYVNRSTYDWLVQEARRARANSSIDLGPEAGPLRFRGVPVFLDEGHGYGPGRRERDRVGVVGDRADAMALTFQGNPIRPTDAILNTDAVIADRWQDQADDEPDEPQPPVVHVVHDWMGQQGQRTTLCGQGDAEAAWSATDQGARVNCDNCIRVRRSMEREQEPGAAEGTMNLRQVPGGVFGYVGSGRRPSSPRKK